MRKRDMLRRSLLLGVGLVLAMGVVGANGYAATRAQLRGQVKLLEQAYAARSWQKVSEQAKKLLQTPSLPQSPKLHAKVLLCLGGMLHAQKLRSLAKAAFAKALRLQPSLQAPVGSGASLSQFFAKIKSASAAEQQYYKNIPAVRAAPTPRPSPKPRGGRLHIGWLIGLPTAVVGLAGFGVGLAAGLNAQANAEKAGSLLLAARNNAFPDPSVTPTINAIHESSKTYGTVSNVSFIAGGVVLAAGMGLMLWAALSPPEPAKSAALPPKSQDKQTVASHSTPNASMMLRTP